MKNSHCLESSLNKIIQDAKVNEYLEMLIDVNSNLWDIENNIWIVKRSKKFDQEFIDLARKVYLTNDKRSEIKLEINKYFGSELVEIKSYNKY